MPPPAISARLAADERVSACKGGRRPILGGVWPDALGSLLGGSSPYWSSSDSRVCAI